MNDIGPRRQWPMTLWAGISCLVSCHMVKADTGCGVDLRLTWFTLGDEWYDIGSIYLVGLPRT